MTVDIIILALIAIYIIIKLYNIIGSDNFSDDFSKKQTPTKEKVLKVVKEAEELVGIETSKETEIIQGLKKSFKSNIAKIKKIDHNFSLEKFLSNSEKAFESVIYAFTNNDSKTINLLTKEKANKNFITAMKEQNKLKHEVNIDIISFINKEIKELQLEKNIARITLLFKTEQIFYILDKDENVLEGNKSKIEQIDDEWIFEKDLKSSNPIWYLVDSGN